PRLAHFVLDRLGYGPRPGSIDEVLARGIERWASAQLAPASDGALEARLAAFPSLARSIGETITRYQADQRSLAVALQEFRSAHFVRAVHGKNQLEEVLTDFWLNHFNVYIGDNVARFGI